MSILVHTISGAPRGWRVLLGLAFKNLEYDVRYVQVSKQEQRSAEFLKLNPRGTVPVLQNDGIILRDSIGILAWLDKRFPENPLFGDTPEIAADIWQLSLELCDYLRLSTHNVLAPVFGGSGVPPEPRSQEMAALTAYSEALHVECQFVESRLVESQLSGKPFLCGDYPSAADAIAFPELRLVQRAVETKPAMMSGLGFSEFSSRYPALTDWRERISALKGIDNTMPVHWKL